ncbi:alpha/beta hydrolase [Amycolatopsis orientalis]|uniref:alpha/beta hydrolase n=1 Tax=Amycolatopsis orientalis TaxID=31958 RepID=UPI0011AB799C|nr:alpha/beta hydrolase [Amycolatopsis orientalis]
MTELVNVGTDEDPVLDVVFVHGLDGDPYKSWSAKRKDSFWPEWLGRDIEGLSIWSLGYDAASSRWLGDSMPIQDRAINSLAELQGHGIGQRPLCFVTHSMGDLVVEEMLLHAADGRADYTTPEDGDRDLDLYQHSARLIAHEVENRLSATG